MLYKKYPKLKNIDNIFLFNNVRIKRFKTLNENNIYHNGVTILFYRS